MSSESITQNEFADECDINYLVEKHVKGGIPFPTSNIYKDVSDVPTFQDAQNTILKAKESWMNLPAKVRRHFNDNIESFLGALSDPNQKDDLIHLKVFQAPEAPNLTAEEPAAPRKRSGEAPPKVEGAAKAPGTGAT